MHVLRRLPYFVLLFFSLFLFLSNTALATEGVQRGISLCLETVFPSLFPFLVLSELILSSGVGRILGKLLSKPFKLLFGTSTAGSGALVLGTLCGQPIASCAALSLYERGEITKKEAQRLSLFANNPGSGFLVAATGSALFGSAAAGLALLCITWLSSAILGILLQLFFKKEENLTKAPLLAADERPFSVLFTSAVQRSLFTLLQVGAFLLFFSSLASVLGGLLVQDPLGGTLRVLLFGILELTTGISSAVATLPAYTAFRVAAFLCSFGGICVCMQIISITQKCEIPTWKYLTAKLAQGGIALLLCEGYLYAFAPALSPSPSVPTISFTARFPALFAALSLLLAGLLWQSHKSKKRGADTARKNKG